MDLPLVRVLSLIKEGTNDVDREIVKVALVFESNAQGAWDREMLPGYPEEGLYDRLYDNNDIRELLTADEQLLADPNIPITTKANLFWAVSKNRQRDPFEFLVKQLLSGEMNSQLLEVSSLVSIVRDFVAMCPHLARESPRLDELRQRIKEIRLNDKKEKAAQKELIYRLAN